MSTTALVNKDSKFKSLLSILVADRFSLTLFIQFQHGDDDSATMGGGACSSDGKSFWDIVSDPRIIDKALDTENVDYNVTMAQTTRYVHGRKNPDQQSEL